MLSVNSFQPVELMRSKAIEFYGFRIAKPIHQLSAITTGQRSACMFGPHNPNR